MTRTRSVSLAIVVALLAGCASAPPPSRRDTVASKPAAKPPARFGGGYLDDGPGDDPPPDLDAIPDAVPRVEPLRRSANKPYTVLGRSYVPDSALKPYKATGTASWYGRRYNGKSTSSGEVYDMYAMTAAHPTLPIPSYARVTNLANQRSVVVRINDRGPFLNDRLIDVSYTAAYKLGLLENGSAPVEVEAIDPSNPDWNKPDAAPPPPAAMAAPVSIPVASDEGGVFLQLGAFGARENAENFSLRLKPQLGDAAGTLHIEARGGLFRVRLGPYPSQTAARQAAETLRQNLSLNAVMVQQ
jgi:rare lipoprotein A